MKKKHPVSDLDADIRDHIERETQDNIERGMSSEEARYAALRKFGNVALAQEDARAVWSWPWVERLARDQRYILRHLYRHPGFAAVSSGVLALGLAATIAMFSIVNSVLFEPTGICAGRSSLYRRERAARSRHDNPVLACQRPPRS